ncbi:MAG: hypothetical protein RJA36_676 [Pseudomonadota bacterium]|jgi:hypothetical protein
MPAVASYSVLIHGGPGGHQNHRALIQLHDSAGDTLALLRFHDADGRCEPDSETGGIIRMHLPAILFQGVLDLLRQEKPVEIHFEQGRACLAAIGAPVGEGER